MPHVLRDGDGQVRGLRTRGQPYPLRGLRGERKGAVNGFVNFVSNPQVHDTVLYTMVVTSFIAALPKWGSVTIRTKIDAIGVFYRFFYDWLVGFWSMKTGPGGSGFGSFIGSTTTYACSTPPILTLQDCGTTPACTSPTSVGTLTLTAANVITVGTLVGGFVPGNEYFDAVLTGGVCTSLDIRASLTGLPW